MTNDITKRDIASAMRREAMGMAVVYAIFAGLGWIFSKQQFLAWFFLSTPIRYFLPILIFIGTIWGIAYFANKSVRAAVTFLVVLLLMIGVSFYSILPYHYIPDLVLSFSAVSSCLIVIVLLPYGFRYRRFRRHGFIRLSAIALVPAAVLSWNLGMDPESLAIVVVSFVFFAYGANEALRRSVIQFMRSPSVSPGCQHAMQGAAMLTIAFVVGVISFVLSGGQSGRSKKR